MSQLMNVTGKSRPQLSSLERRKRVIPLSYQLLGLLLNLLSRVHMNLAAEILKNLFFKVFKSPAKPWLTDFWRGSDSFIELQFEDRIIPVHLWGQGPLVVMMHGWSGSGAQFRRLIPGLVAAGYQVAAFDAPAHGRNPGKKTHLLEFVDCLLGIQQRIGPVHTLMAHSFGAMAALTACQRGLAVEQLVLFGPHLDVNEIHQSYSELLSLNPKLSKRFAEKIGARMADIIGREDVWSLFTPRSLLDNCDIKGLLIYDSDDEEIPQSQFEAVRSHWQFCQVMKTRGLGHQKILKDDAVIEAVQSYLGPAG